MASNLSKLLKIASILDKNGNYFLSDKLDSLIKVSQNYLPSLFSDAKNIPIESTGNPLIDMQYRNLEDSAAGSMFAKDKPNKMFSYRSPYYSSLGPSGPAILKTRSPKELEELLKTPEGRKLIQQETIAEGLKAQEYENLSNVGFVNFGKFVELNLGPGVPKDRKQVFVNSTMPGTIKNLISNLLMNFPVGQWQTRLDEFYRIANSYPEYSSSIKTTINQAVQYAMQNLKYRDQERYNKTITDPKFRDFANRFNV